MSPRYRAGQNKSRQVGGQFSEAGKRASELQQLHCGCQRFEKRETRRRRSPAALGDVSGLIISGIIPGSPQQISRDISDGQTIKATITSSSKRQQHSRSSKSTGDV
jgi:hypothetical protein